MHYPENLHRIFGGIPVYHLNKSTSNPNLSGRNEVKTEAQQGFEVLFHFNLDSSSLRFLGVEID